MGSAARHWRSLGRVREQTVITLVMRDCGFCFPHAFGWVNRKIELGLIFHGSDEAWCLRWTPQPGGASGVTDRDCILRAARFLISGGDPTLIIPFVLLFVPNEKILRREQWCFSQLDAIGAYALWFQ
jgi:hypothetical protein